jgi:hypothetical protein
MRIPAIWCRTIANKTLTAPHRTGAKAMREGVAAWEREGHDNGDLEDPAM